MDSRKIARTGLMVAAAFVLSYIESLLPLDIGLPGAKVGLSNIVVIFCLFKYGPAFAFKIAMVRIVLCGFTFGSLSGMMYSFAGGILSFVVMLALKKTKKFSIYGISAAGGAAHNIGQLIVAALVVRTKALVFYLPFLMIAGAAAGTAIGLFGGMLFKRLKNVEI